MSILSRLNVSAYVIAAEPSRLLVIRDEHVWSFIGISHEFACNLLRTLSGRVRDNNTRLQVSMHAQAHYARASRVDSLTGLHNRRWLDEVLERQCPALRRGRHTVVSRAARYRSFQAGERSLWASLRG